MKIGKLNVVNKRRIDVLNTLIEVVGSHSKTTAYVCFCEAHLFVQAHRDPSVLSALQDSTFIFPDGTSLALGGLLTGKRLRQRHPGPAIMPELCDKGQQHDLKHYFLGGEEGVGERLKAKLEALYPRIQIVGFESPPFRQLTNEEERDIRERIEISGANVLWVGLGAPKQELWMQKQSKKMKIPLMLGVGAAFDYLVGDQKWAPVWMRKFGMEWLYRMITGGSRLLKRYLKYVPLCCYYLIKESILRR